MSFISGQAQERVKKELEELKNEVKLAVFTQEIECAHCRENVSLATEVAALSDKVKLQIHDFQIDKERRDSYGIDKIPAIAVEGVKDYGIRFYGLPGGYEFMSLLEAMKGVSEGESGLSAETKEKLRSLSKPVHIQVFVTLTCPYCPGAVKLAHKLALESDMVRSDMVESSEFPHLGHKYDVFAVPRTIVNEEIRFDGALPEAAFVEQVMRVAHAGG